MSIPADDKIGALVGLVLQAVDERLTAVREQLVEVANTVARNHIELQEQINECRDSIALRRDAPLGVSTDDSHEAASAALLQAANLLTERVTFFESRLQQYTDDQVAELRSLLDQLPPGVGAPSPAASVAASVAGVVTPAAAVVSPVVAALKPVSPVAASLTPVTAVTAPAAAAATAPVEDVRGLSPVLAQLGSLSTPARVALTSLDTGPSAVVGSAAQPLAAVAPLQPLTPVAKVPSVKAAAATAPVAAVAPVVTVPAAAAHAAPATPAPAPAAPAPAVEFDIDAFSAQLNARLSALVEKAIGV